MREAAHIADKPASGGRPRSESCRIALLETAFSLMKEHPIHAISTQHIAAEAGVSTATLYRWWPTKEALLLDAFLHMKQRQTPVKESASPLQRIRDRFVASGKSLQGENGVVAARLMAAIQDDPQLRDAFAERFYGPHRSEMMAIAKEAVKAGELPARTDLKFFLDSLFGACLVRLMMRHESIRCSDLAQSFDLAVAAARSYWGEQ
ncbi:MAG: TetR/AcrR family transcriptional regulator [Bryobacteraceae bacterium]